MTQGQQRRSQYFLRTSHEVVLEARDSFAKRKFDRVVRKSHEAVELYLKSLLLGHGIEPAKSHDLAALVIPLGDQVKIAEAGLARSGGFRVVSSWFVYLRTWSTIFFPGPTFSQESSTNS